MKITRLLLISFYFVTLVAHADGFMCQDLWGKNYLFSNSRALELGTRTLVEAEIFDRDELNGDPGKSIRKFSTSTGTLDTDLDFGWGSREYILNMVGRTKEATIAGIPLGNITAMAISIEHAYNKPIPHDAWVFGELTIFRKSEGGVEDPDPKRTHLNCWRILYQVQDRCKVSLNGKSRFPIFLRK